MTTLRGGCLCGRVRYESDATPFHQTLCHCATCRRASGAHAVAWLSVASASLRYDSGPADAYRSSPGVERGFCGRCGTTLTYRRDDLPDEIDLAIATLDDADAWPPLDHTQAGERLRWDHLQDDLPVFEAGRTA